jgi:hypothetical protein
MELSQYAIDQIQLVYNELVEARRTNPAAGFVDEPTIEDRMDLREIILRVENTLEYFNIVKYQRSSAS